MNSFNAEEAEAQNAWPQQIQENEYDVCEESPTVADDQDLIYKPADGDSSDFYHCLNEESARDESTRKDLLIVSPGEHVYQEAHS